MAHLTDMELATFLSGKGTPPERARYAAHLAECPACLRDYLDAFRDLGLEEGAGGSSPLPEPVCAANVEAEPDLEKGPETAGGEPFFRAAGPAPGRAFRLVRAAEDPDEALGDSGDPGDAAPLPWAASAPIPDLPVLTTEDSRFLVRFRRPELDGPLCAYLIADLPAVGAGSSLQILSRETTYDFGEDGTVELPGVEAKDLAAGNLVLRLVAREEREGDL